MPTSPKRVLILGGGISGLMAAWRLRRPGLEVEVWEASRAAGGWAQTLPWPGPRGEPGLLERGPQSLRPRPGDALDRLLTELGLPCHPARPGGPRWLGKDGRRRPSPTSLAGLLGAPDLTPGERLRLLAEPFVRSRSGPNESLRGFFTRRLGEGFARELLPSLVAGLLAAPPERIAVAALPLLLRLEADGGLLRGGLRLGLPGRRQPVGGTGALARTLAARLGCVVTGRPALDLEPLAGGRWRCHGPGAPQEADTVVLALPAGAAAGLLAAAAPGAAALLRGLPTLDLQVWHSRHPMVPGWERGLGLLVHPPEGSGLLGVASLAADDPRGVPGLLQLRTFLGGAYPVPPALETWPGVFRELRRWLPELPDPLQVRAAYSPGAFPLLEPGHGDRMRRLLGEFPANLHWIGAARFGPGLPDLAEGIEAWAGTAAI